MADFAQAIAKTELFEGGYVFNVADTGGETYRGISRNNWPTWAGWTIVDATKKAVSLMAKLDGNSTLQGLVVDFYRKNFWSYDNIIDQYIAWKVFDIGVNIGKSHAVKILQSLVGTVQDGVYGPKTEAATNSHPDGSLGPGLRAAVANYHRAIVATHPQDAIFLKGWLARDAV